MLPDERVAGPLIKSRPKKDNAAAPNLVKVVVRLRPGKQGEGRDTVTVDSATPNTIRCEDPIEKVPGLGQGFNRSGGFTVDHAFGPAAPTSELYQDAVQRLVKSVVNSGTNACCFAYGATGSGKTYTMDGTATSPGVMQYAIGDLFAWAAPGATVVASYFQIYNEVCTDLLTASAKADEPVELHVRMDADGRTQVVGLREVVVSTADELLALVADGSARRATTGTAVNETSSRSHAVLQIALKQPARPLVAKLSLIDLAGSERATRANTTGQAFNEAKNINHSLLALSKVIRARVEGTKANYRESKLTRLLEDSLTGGATTTMVCACSPAASVFDETLQTLQRAHEVKQIKRPLAPAPPVRAYLAPRSASVPRAVEDAAIALGARPRPHVPPLRGLRRASHEPITVASSSPITSPSRQESDAGVSPTRRGAAGAAPDAHPREMELVALLERVRRCDDAKVAIFLRASNALLDGLDESYARLDRLDHGAIKHRLVTAPVPPPAQPPVVTRQKTPSPVGSPLSENAPALMPVSTRGLLANRLQNLHQRQAMVLDGVHDPAVGAPLSGVPPPPRGLLSSISAVGFGDEKIVGGQGANRSRPTTPPLPRRGLARPSSYPSSRVPTPPLMRAPAVRTGSAPGGSRPSSLPSSRSDSPRAKSARAATVGCVSACVPSADGTSVYKEVGYRSPPDTDQIGVDAVEQLS